MEKETEKDLNTDVEEEEVESEEEEETPEDPYADLDRETAIERLKKAESLIVKNKQKPKPQRKEVPSKLNRNGDISELEEKIELKLTMKQEGYPKEAIDYVMEHGGAKALEHPVVKRVVEEMKEQAVAETASQIKSASQSPALKEFTEADIENMSADEMRKALLGKK